MPGKPISPEGLARDLAYVLEGTVFHEAFYEVCPPRPGLTVLEPGCGSGKFGMAYYLRRATVVLIDVDPGVLAYTRALLGQLPRAGGGYASSMTSAESWDPKTNERWRINTIEGSIHDLAKLFPDERFDLVLNEGVPHHWPREDPRRQGAIDQMAAVTKPGGKVAVMVSNDHSAEMRHYAETIKHTYAGMPEVQVPFSQDELLEALMRAGLQHVGVRPVESVVLERARTLLGYGTKGKGGRDA